MSAMSSSDPGVPEVPMPVPDTPGESPQVPTPLPGPEIPGQTPSETPGIQPPEIPVNDPGPPEISPPTGPANPTM